MTEKTTKSTSDVPAEATGTFHVPRLDQQLCFALYS
ncbi:MarR family transcriptional regulator, partial [Mesorhizobium sp. M7A.F.Ca.MR.228.00.0.0]